MKYPHYVEKYLKRKGAGLWSLSSLPHSPVAATVVIPALAERDNLFQTLLSLGRNRGFDFSGLLVICVINNRPAGIAPQSDIENNAETMAYLDYLSGGRRDSPIPESILTSGEVEEIRKSGINTVYVDASSAGRALPEKGGVGLARKIGMDLALTVFDYEKPGRGLMICLDADTVTGDNYISEITRYFSENKKEAALLSFAHRLPKKRRHLSAIACYEIFLRYYKMGLQYAGTPYAFHTVGSTMVCTAKSYVAIGGMNTKEAGEDFYFLQKLAKFTAMGDINSTTVYPSARVSNRVPFGTGRTMGEMDASGDEFFPFYNPRSFEVLQNFITLMRKAVQSGNSDGKSLLGECRKMEPLLANFLESKNFADLWEKLRKNNPNKEKLLRSFHEWFDAFAILKLVHHLRDEGYKEMPMIQAVGTLMKMMDLRFPFNDVEGENCDKAVELLRFMRKLEKGD